MKVIKFRAWDGLNKTMSYWTINDLCNHTEDSDTPSCFEEWMQYTGLRDKNDKEIYDGDICKMPSNDYLVQVVWYISRWEFFTMQNELAESFSGFHDEYEVIGNIYENKDLLNN